jgi:hypothetical protein
MFRCVITFFGYSIRLHHWVASDDQRYLHDHPWWMLILVLKGSYKDIGEKVIDKLTFSSIRFRRANHRHTVLVDNSCWSLLITGRPINQWGFYIPNRIKRLRPLRYFSRYGHHPCT